MGWVYLDDGFPEHPKVERAGGAAAWLFVCVLAYCNRHLTGGVIPKSKVGRLTDARNPAALAKKLVDVVLLVDADDDYLVHDYAFWNESAEKRREQASKAAKARWAKERAPSNAGASDEHADEHVPEQCRSDAYPQPLTPRPSSSSEEPPAAPPAETTTTESRQTPDLDQLWHMLARRDLRKRIDDGKGTPGDEQAWLAEAGRRREQRHAADVARWLAERPEQTVEALADRLSSGGHVQPPSTRSAVQPSKFAPPAEDGGVSESGRAAIEAARANLNRQAS